MASGWSASSSIRIISRSSRPISWPPFGRLASVSGSSGSFRPAISAAHRVAAGPDGGDERRRRAPSPRAGGRARQRAAPRERPRGRRPRRRARAPAARAITARCAGLVGGEGGEAGLKPPARRADPAQLGEVEQEVAAADQRRAAAARARSRARPSSPRRRCATWPSSTGGRCLVADHRVGLQHEVRQDVARRRGRPRSRAYGSGAAVPVITAFEAVMADTTLKGCNEKTTLIGVVRCAHAALHRRRAPGAAPSRRRRASRLAMACWLTPCCAASASCGSSPGESVSISTSAWRGVQSREISSERAKTAPMHRAPAGGSLPGDRRTAGRGPSCRGRGRRSRRRDRAAAARSAPSGSVPGPMPTETRVSASRSSARRCARKNSAAAQRERAARGRGTASRRRGTG